jgi:hypothetical protein
MTLLRNLLRVSSEGRNCPEHTCLEYNINLRVFHRGQSDRGVKLTIPFHLRLKSEIAGVIPPLCNMSLSVMFK